MNEKLEKLIFEISAKVTEARGHVSIPGGVEDLDAFNQIIIKNPGHLIYYNNLFIKVREVRLCEECKLTEMYAKLYCKHKTAVDKISDNTVLQMIFNDEEYQNQKRTVIRLESLEDSLKGVLGGLRAQLDALQTVCNNLRAERRTI